MKPNTSNVNFNMDYIPKVSAFGDYDVNSGSFFSSGNGLTGNTNSLTGGISSGTGAASQSSLQNTLFGGKENVGVLTGGAQAISSLASAWTGMQQYKLAKENLSFQKSAYNTNLQNSAITTNAAIEDKYRNIAGTLGSDVAAERFGTLSEYVNARKVSAKTI